MTSANEQTPDFGSTPNRRSAKPHATTLPDLIRERSRSPATWLILPVDPMATADAKRVSFQEICASAERFADSLGRVDVHGGAPVMLVFDNNESYCGALLGCLLAGVVPITRSPPWLNPRFMDEIAGIQSQSEARLVIVDDAYASTVSGRGFTHARCLTASELLSTSGRANPPLSSSGVSADAPALIQYSSGSTREPMGVALSHAGIIAHIAALGAAIRASEDDVLVSWLPVSHDMGLVGSLLYSFYWGIPLVFSSPLDFVTRPASWLWAISRFRGTASAAPNFAYNLCASPQKVSDKLLEGLDLSTWRIAVNGAEAVQAETVRQFTQRYDRFGFRSGAVCPAYGLAENGAGCSLSVPGVDPCVDRVDRDGLERDGVADVVRPGTTLRTATFVGGGTPLPGTEIRVVHASGACLPDRRVGEIQFRGTSAMLGYWKRPEATAEASASDGWFRTGDLGYMAAGEVYVVGRSKRLIKRAGRHYDGAELADVAGNVEGIRPGCVNVMSVPDALLGSERVVAMIEIRDGWLAFEETVTGVRRAISRSFGLHLDEVLLLEPRTLPKSSSGKIQVQQCIQLYGGGELRSKTRFSSTLAPTAHRELRET